MFSLGKATPGKLELRELWDVEAGDYVIDLAWSPTGAQLAFVTVDGHVFLIDDVITRGRLRPLGQHAGGANSVSWRADGGELATAGHDGIVRVWDPVSGTLQRELSAGADWVAKVVYRPRGSELASAAGRIVKVWANTGSAVYESAEHASTIADIAWNPDGSELAVAAYNGVTRHNPLKSTPPRKYEWKGSSLTLAWSPTAKYIATGEQDSTVHFWTVKTGDDCQMSGYATKALELSWHHTGDYLATGGGDTATLWSCNGKGPRGRKPKEFEGHVAKITQLVFQHRSDQMASGDGDGMVMIWNPLKSLTHLTGRFFETAVTRLAWSPNDQYLVVGQKNGLVTVLHLGIKL